MSSSAAAAGRGLYEPAAFILPSHRPYHSLPLLTSPVLHVWSEKHPFRRLCPLLFTCGLALWPCPPLVRPHPRAVADAHGGGPRHRIAMLARLRASAGPCSPTVTCVEYSSAARPAPGPLMSHYVPISISLNVLRNSCGRCSCSSLALLHEGFDGTRLFRFTAHPLATSGSAPTRPSAAS